MANSSTAAQHRIITTFSNIKEWKNYDLIVLNLIYFFEGKHIHINEGWKCSCGHSSLVANREGRRVLKILKAANVRVEFDNDAPRGGAVGSYFKCLRKNAAAAEFFRGLLAEVKSK